VSLKRRINLTSLVARVAILDTRLALEKKISQLVDKTKTITEKEEKQAYLRKLT